MNVLEQLATASRLEQMGVTVRSAELVAEAERIAHFRKHGNREMRRAARRSQRRRSR